MAPLYDSDDPAFNPFLHARVHAGDLLKRAQPLAAPPKLRDVERLRRAVDRRLSLDAIWTEHDLGGEGGGA